jgi:acid phosphatase class B
MKVSFDFDDTLCFEVPNYGWYGGGCSQVSNVDLIEVFKFYKLFVPVGILTARGPSDSNKKDVEKFCERFDLKPDFIIYTNHKYKNTFAVREKIVLHYDDDDGHLESCIDSGIRVIDSKVTSIYKKLKGEDDESGIR